MEHKMHLNRDKFELVEEGLKTVEVRRYDVKRKDIKVNDIMVFVRRPDLKEVNAKVTNVKILKSFGEVHDQCHMEDIGYPGISKEGYETVMEGFYPHWRGEVITIAFELV